VFRKLRSKFFNVVSPSGLNPQWFIVLVVYFARQIVVSPERFNIQLLLSLFPLIMMERSPEGLTTSV